MEWSGVEVRGGEGVGEGLSWMKDYYGIVYKDYINTYLLCMFVYVL